jgi:hypothetical protein
MTGRDCSYASQAPPTTLSASGAGPPELPISPSGKPSQGGITLVDVAPTTISPTAASRFAPDSSEHLAVDDHQNSALGEVINLDHMQLLIHLTLNEDMWALSGGITPSGLSFGLKTAIESPYLLHQLLAFSSRHLAFLHPKRAAFYLHLAVGLQTRAVSLFNSTWKEVDQSNCVSVLLFSVVLGHHLLADTLAKRDSSGLGAFMAHYLQCVEMHRGIYAIATTAWPLLMESELEPILSWSSGFNTRSLKGNHCQKIQELVDGAEGLREEDKDVCRQAVRYLQIGFDAVLAEEEPGNRYQMICSWMLLSPPEFTELLAAKRPEVLVVLAYYALLLHYGRNMWQIGDAGPYILGIVGDYLGPEWDPWLALPRAMIAKDLE